ncbi:DUF3422 domain-containing protein [Pseudomonas sp. 2FG]|uniref:DUF3422 domain-containing protein n=1 Tax=Pseudomonas sp. 2FG TaxID=2502191 RepID=UPI0010F6C797|nr:DUF3422 domain-containing protein [Pseudomonas sp. 2FG]
MHPLRKALHNELHSRPSIYFDGPAYVYHLAFIDPDDQCDAIISSLYAQAGALYDRSTPQGLIKLGTFALKWERHTEFFTLTLVAPKSDGETAEIWQPLPAVLKGIVEAHRDLIINADLIQVETQQSWAGDYAFYGFKDPAGSSVGGGDATVWSDFKLDQEGMNRILLINRGLNAYRLGRMIRRLLEIETYRMMASLTLPVAQSISVSLKEFDKELTGLSDSNAETASGDAKHLLNDIAALSARIVRSTARSRRRFSATDAYSKIVFERIGELREAHLGDCQRLGVFIERRFKPTVRYCAATDQRLQRLGHSVANLSELLQARVQVEVEAQNSEILHSLNSRANTQIKIQKAVEGLSLIAISYYLLSLFKLVFEGLHTVGLKIEPLTAATYMTPIALFILGFIALRIRQAKSH